MVEHHNSTKRRRKLSFGRVSGVIHLKEVTWLARENIHEENTSTHYFLINYKNYEGVAIQGGWRNTSMLPRLYYCNTTKSLERPFVFMSREHRMMEDLRTKRYYKILRVARLSNVVYRLCGGILIRLPLDTASFAIGCYFSSRRGIFCTCLNEVGLLKRVIRAVNSLIKCECLLVKRTFNIPSADTSYF